MEKKRVVWLLRKYKEGKISDEESAFLHAYFEQKVIESETSLLDEEEKFDAIEAHLLNRIHTRILSPTANTPFYLIAAAVIGLLVVATSVLLQRRFVSHPPSKPVAETLKETVTKPGQLVKITLSDGSEVWLNGQSRLKYPLKFKSDVRRVFLEGEAFFHVAKDKIHPFIVYSEKITTRVVGTQFNISSFKSDNTSVVSVLEGSVQVERVTHHRNVGRPTTLTAFQKAVYWKKSDTLVMSDAPEVGETMSWRDGTVFFNYIPLSEAAKMLERRFGRQILISKSLASAQVYGKYSGMSLQTILRIVAKALGAKVTRKENKVLLFKSESK